MIAEPGRHRLVGERERDRQAAEAGVKPRVAEQRQAVYGDRAEADQSEVLVQAHQGLAEPRAAQQLGRHRQPEQHRGA